MTRIPNPAYVANSSLGVENFACMYNAYNVQKDEFDMESALDGGMKESMRRVKNLVVISKSDAPYQAFPAREFVFSGRQKGIDFVLHRRMVGVGTSMYQQIYMTTGSHGGSNEKRFFNSFRILADGNRIEYVTAP